MTKCRLLEIGMRIPTFRICNCLLQLWMGFAGPFLGAQGIQILLDFQIWHWNFNPKFYIHIYAAWLEVTSLATRLVLRWSDHLNWWSTKDWSWQQKKKNLQVIGWPQLSLFDQLTFSCWLNCPIGVTFGHGSSNMGLNIQQILIYIK